MMCPRLSGPELVSCVGSVCMWWRWSEDKPKRRFLDGTAVTDGEKAGRGYCGVVEP